MLLPRVAICACDGEVATSAACVFVVIHLAPAARLPPHRALTTTTPLELQATFDGVSRGVFPTAEEAARCVDACAVACFGRALAAARGVHNLP
jgi:hypothetical protein